MDVTLPLDQMTTSEKLRALEEIWDDLCGDPESVPSPSWHGGTLRAREQRVQEGPSRFGDWDQAKQEVRDSAKCA